MTTAQDRAAPNSIAAQADSAEPSRHSLVAGSPLPGSAGLVRATDPTTGEPVGPTFSLLTVEQVELATAAAADAFDALRGLRPDRHGAFLDLVARRIDDCGDEVVDIAMRETGLPEARLRGELARTTGQLRLFADVVRTGHHLGVRVDPALPDRTPLPRADIRQMKAPLGPVAVFGASNFPLAFSTAGGDTASALAAGCPVVVKAHNAHPGTGLVVGRAVSAAVRDSGLHPGTFSLVYGPGASIGQALAADPHIKAVAFTGSRPAGTALVRTASQRPEPIPVYAEMSSVNPVVVLPGAIEADAASLANAYVTSLTGSAGQLCTVPGLVFVPQGDRGDEFLAAVAVAVSGAMGQTMLTAGIANARRAGADALGAADRVTEVARGDDGPGANAPGPVVFCTDVDAFRHSRDSAVMREEIFGAAGLAVRYRSTGDLVDVLAGLEGQLTATVHFTGADTADVAQLLPVLAARSGRVVANGWPTGVEVGHAMVHGGPYPATSDPRSTSVGTLAVDRFLRPVAFQNLPQELLPEPLRDGNPWQVTRLVDGTLEPGTGLATS